MSRAPIVFDARDCFYQYTANIRHALLNADEARATGHDPTMDILCAREWMDNFIKAMKL